MDETGDPLKPEGVAMSYRGLFIVCFLILSSQVSKASILVEPYLGYTLAEYDTGSTSDANGIVLGARLGYELPVIWFGLDYMMTDQTVELSPDQDGEASRLGLVVGATAPMGVRVWGAYYLSDSFEFDSGTELEGTGIKFGVGFRMIPLLHLNFEYLMSTYDEANGASIADREMNGFIVSASVPLSF